MPVDRNGKLTFKDKYSKLLPRYNASRYATPINRKPKRRKRISTRMLIGWLSLIALIVALAFFTVRPGTPHRYWRQVLNYHGFGSQETAYFHVSDTWRLTWSCGASGYSLSIHPVTFGTSSKPMPPINAVCDTGSASGTAQMSRGGQVALNVVVQETLGIVTLNSWSVNVQDLE